MTRDGEGEGERRGGERRGEEGRGEEGEGERKGRGEEGEGERRGRGEEGEGEGKTERGDGGKWTRLLKQAATYTYYRRVYNCSMHSQSP